MMVIKSDDNESVATTDESKVQAVLIALMILQPSTRSCFCAKAQSQQVPRWKPIICDFGHLSLSRSHPPFSFCWSAVCTRPASGRSSSFRPTFCFAHLHPFALFIYRLFMPTYTIHTYGYQAILLTICALICKPINYTR